VDDWLGMLVAGIVVDLIPVNTTFEFDRTRNLARFGNKVVDCSLIDDARLEVEDRIFTRNLSLVFGIKGTIRLELPLTKGSKDVVPEYLRGRVIEMLEASSIVIPNNDPYDQKGKFARSGSPSNITREEAIALVRRPPLPGEQLPIFI